MPHHTQPGLVERRRRPLLLPLLVTAGALALTACGRKEEAAEAPATPAAGTSASTEASPPASVPATPPAPTTAAPGTDAAMSASAPAGTGAGATGSTGATPATGTTGAAATAAIDGAAVYNQACVACHGAGVAGAPKLGDKADWAPRIAQGKDVLYTHAIQGYQGKKGVMPPRGGSTKSDDEIRAAVDYMASQ